MKGQNGGEHYTETTTIKRQSSYAQKGVKTSYMYAK